MQILLILYPKYVINYYGIIWGVTPHVISSESGVLKDPQVVIFDKCANKVNHGRMLMV